MSDVGERAQVIVMQFARSQPESVGPDTAILAGLHVDSLDFVHMIVLLEGEFNITLDHDQIQNIVTLGDLENQLHAHMQRQGVA